MNRFSDLLAKRGVLLADGATGTNLFDMGLISGEAPETWINLHPHRIQALHRSFVDAGADIILTNSFGANARRLMLHDMQTQTYVLNKRAAEIAREVADKASRPVIVAGSVGPTGDLLAPLGPLSENDACDVFIQQMEGLRDGGADIAWIETMSALEEMQAAVTAAGRVGLACTLTASFDTAGRTMMGIKPEALALFAAGLPQPPLAIGSNCGVGAADLVVSILALSASSAGLPIIAKANAGIPTVHGDHTHYSGTPDTMAAFAHLAIDAGATIIGGCCGTTPAHLAAIRRAIDYHQTGVRPTQADIVAQLGALVSPPSDHIAPRGRHHRRAH